MENYSRSKIIAEKAAWDFWKALPGYLIWFIKFKLISQFLFGNSGESYQLIISHHFFAVGFDLTNSFSHN